jgi:hypothetical protein
MLGSLAPLPNPIPIPQPKELSPVPGVEIPLPMLPKCPENPLGVANGLLFGLARLLSGEMSEDDNGDSSFKLTLLEIASDLFVRRGENG